MKQAGPPKLRLIIDYIYMIENEEHMLTKCTLYERLRNLVFAQVKSTNNQLNLNNIHTLLSANKVLNSLVVFICKCFKLRENTIQVLSKQ